MEFKSALFDSGKSLKDQNRWLIRSYVLLLAAAVAIGVVGFDELRAFGQDLVTGSLASIAPALVVYVLASLAAFLLLGLLPSLWRDRLAHLRWKNPLPGARAFTEIGVRDPRVDLSRLEQRFGSLPTTLEIQNQLWYRIYREHQDELSVLDAHRSYLLSRDLTVATWVMLPICVRALSHWSSVGWNVLSYAGFLALFAVVLGLCTRTYGTRFIPLRFTPVQ